MRNLHADTIAELQNNKAHYMFHLVALYLDSGTERFTTSHADVDFDSNTYQASRRFLKFGNVKETERLEIGSMNFIFTAVDQTILAEALSQTVVNRVIELYRGMLNPTTYAVINSPTRVYSGRIKSFSMKEDPGGISKLTFQTASALADFDRTAGRRTNQQDQGVYLNIKYGGAPPVDTGFQYAHQMHYDIQWGKLNTKSS